MSETYSCFVHGDHAEEQCPKCKEPQSSNLVVQCRHEAGNHGVGTSARGLLDQAADEIERLTAELERIKCERTEAIEGFENDNTRLRAALTWAMNKLRHGNRLNFQCTESRIAREVLAGAADETPAARQAAFNSKPAPTPSTSEGAHETTAVPVPTDNELVGAMRRVCGEIVANQRELDPEAKRVLYANIEKLYQR